MNLLGSRSEMEAALSKALSRYIGYTTGAYDLQRIISVLDAFGENPSLYRDEVVAYLGSSDKQTEESVEIQKTTSDDYRAEILSFAKSMGLIEAVSRRDARLERLAPTEMGRTVLGAKEVADENFYRFLRLKMVLLADADAIYPILKYHAVSANQDLQTYYQEFMQSLRQRRLDWLTAAFSERILLERIASEISWLSPSKGDLPGSYKIDTISKNTARHHVTPRKGWLDDLGLLDRKTGELTKSGEDVLFALSQGSQFFWLGPPQELQAQLRIPTDLQSKGPYEDTLFVRRDWPQPSKTDLRSLVDDVVHVMLKGYPASKLRHASQASLRLPIEYIVFRGIRDTLSYDWKSVIDELFKIKRNELERFSAQKGAIGFYRPRAGASKFQNE